MATFKYSDLLTEAQDSAVVLEFDGGTITLRAMESLNKHELKLMMTLLDIVQDENVSTEVKLDTMDQIMVASADNKDEFKRLLDEMPLGVKKRLFNEWAGAESQGNS